MMSLRKVVPVAALAVACLGGSAGAAQPVTGKAPPALEHARNALAAAVAAKDRFAVAKLSRFPLAVEVYGAGPKLSEREFLRDESHFDGWFFSGDPETVKCLKTQPFAYQPDKKEFGAGLWYLDCNGNEYYFGAGGGTWAFAAYQNINE
jgi:hypothetical protein